jgi:hypothetical protein
MSRLAALLPICLALLTACAGAKPKPQQQATGRTSHSVPAAADSDALAATALRTWATTTGGDSQALNLARSATQREPERPDLAWLQVRICNEIKGCQAEPLETQLRKLDPGNGVTWLGALARAQAQRDSRAEEQILEAMGKSERFDLYWTTLVSRLGTALNAQTTNTAEEKNPLTTALNDTTSWLSKLATPALKPLTVACEQQRLRDAAVVARCQRIAQAMQRSDTTLVEGLGLGIAQRLTRPGTNAAIVIEERVATLTYQSQAAGSIVQAQIERDKFSAQMIELMKKLRREQEVSNAILRWAGQPTTPP